MTKAASQDITLSKRLSVLVTKNSAQNLRAQMDFDHLINDGLSDERSNLLSQA